MFLLWSTLPVRTRLPKTSEDKDKPEKIEKPKAKAKGGAKRPKAQATAKTPGKRPKNE